MKNITLWCESEAEVHDFLILLENQQKFIIEKVYIAKRSAGKRDVGHKYLAGQYYIYDIDNSATLDETVSAPDFITSLVQHCSQDIIIASDSKPLLCIETTYHILTYNNVAQRIPRLIRCAQLGVPSIIFQKVDYSFETEIIWFVKTFHKASLIFKTPCIPLIFDEKEFVDAKELLLKLINYSVEDEQANFSSTCATALKNTEGICNNYDETRLILSKNNKPRNWLKVSDNEVLVTLGVRDNCALTGKSNYGCQGSEKQRREFRKSLKFRPKGTKGCVWLSKGTGGMDPYPGLIRMAEILLCYNSEGKRIRKLKVHFSCLPEDFWWFEKNPNEIYYKLVREFAETLTYSDTYK